MCFFKLIKTLLFVIELYMLLACLFNPFENIMCNLALRNEEFRGQTVRAL